jgi:hypothetical protein
MTIYVDIVSRKIISSPRLKRDVSRIEVKRGDIIPFSIIFIQNGEPVGLGANHTVALGAKLKNDNEGTAMVLASFTQAGTAIPYTGNVNFGGDALAQHLTNEVDTIDDYTYVDLQMEINWINSVTTLNKTTNSIILRVYNDIIKGGEIPPVINDGVPFEFPDGLKTNEISELTNGSGVLVSSTLIASHIHGNIAGSVYSHIRAGEALVKGDPVYVSGYHSGTNVPIVSKADASNAAKMPAVGIMDAALANNGSGHMVIIGTITNINTAAYAVNAELYVAASGGLTATAPSDRAQPVARVERSNANNGAIIVTIGGLSARNATANTLVRRGSDGETRLFSLICDEFDIGNNMFSASSLGNVTFSSSSTVNFNSTTYNYALGGSAAAAHRTALGLTTLATTTPAVNVATFLETPTSANLAAAVTGETGSGALVFGTSPTIDAPTISGSAAFTSTTRPTSAGTGTPAATSLITRNDAALDRLLSIGQLIHINAASMVTSIGFGGFAGGGNDEMNLVSNTTANGYARAQVSRDMGIWGGAGMASAQIPMTFAFSLIINIPASGNTEYAFVVGEVGSGSPIALGSNPLGGRGFGFRMFYSVANARNELQLFAHNGTTYSESSAIAMASTSSPVMTVVLSSDGAGNVKLLLGTPVSPIWQHVRPSLTPVLSLSTGPSSGNLWQAFASHIVRNGSTAPTSSLSARPKNMIMEVGNVLF